MSADTHASQFRERGLWFGFCAAAVAWVLLGTMDLMVTWRMCMHQEQFGMLPGPSSARIVYALLALVLFILAMASGAVSYHNWRSLTLKRDLLNTQAVDRREFMAFVGILVSITLGMGIVWLSLPPFFLDLCWRAR